MDGILLGTGGLARAYTQATIEAIENSKIIQTQTGYEIKFEILYSDLNFVKYYIEKAKCKIIELNYMENVEIVTEATTNLKDKMENLDSEIGKKIQKIVSIQKKYIQKNADI